MKRILLVLLLVLALSSCTGEPRKECLTKYHTDENGLMQTEKECFWVIDTEQR